MSIKKEIADKEFQSFVDVGKDETARRVDGSVTLKDGDGSLVGVDKKDNVGKTLVSDLGAQDLLEYVVEELKEINRKLSIIIDEEVK